MSGRCMTLSAFLAPSLFAQTMCLSLSSAAVAPAGTAALELSLKSPLGTPQPASLQWNFHFPSSAISNVTVNDGPAATAADKTVFCAANASTYTCMAVGANAKTIADGVIARVTVMLAIDSTAATIRIGNPIGASIDGHFISISTVAGTVNRGDVAPDRRSHPPLKGIAGNRCFPAR
jgi:hypothetical protein